MRVIRNYFVLVIISFLYFFGVVEAKEVPEIVEIKKIHSPSGLQDDWFGVSSVINGDILVVGAPSLNQESSNTFGSVYIFQKSYAGKEEWEFLKKITSSDGVKGDAFGRSLAIYDDTLVVGAPVHNYFGAVYVFQRNAGGENRWGEVKKLLPSGAISAEFFGLTLSIERDTLVVGSIANNQTREMASASVFKRDSGGVNNWGEIKKIVYDAHVIDGNISSSTTIGDDLIAVAVTEYSRAFVKIYAKNMGGENSWAEMQEITCDSITDYDEAERCVQGNSFGFALDINGDTLAITALGDCFYGDASGAVYLFQRSDTVDSKWEYSQTLRAFDGEMLDGFGVDVVLYQNFLAIGSLSYHNITTPNNSGAVYLYQWIEGEDWKIVKKILPSDVSADQRFGRSVDMITNRLAVSALYTFDDEDPGSEPVVSEGAVYLYRIGPEEEITDEDIAGEDIDRDSIEDEDDTFEESDIVDSFDDSNDADTSSSAACLILFV